MSSSSALVTAAEISRLAGVTRATVSNWRRRHEGFPAPVGGSDTSPLYDVKAVRAWLAERGYDMSVDPSEELRTLLRQADGGAGVVGRLIPFVLAATESSARQRADWSGLPDAELAERAGKAVGTALADMEPTADSAPVSYRAADASLLRAVAACVDAELSAGGTGATTLDLLAQRELLDSAATGSYSTPAPVAELMAALLAAVHGGSAPDRVLDPACGGGSLLAAAAAMGATELYGQDIAAVQAQRAAVQLRITAGGTRATVRVGDSLRADAFPELAVDGVLSAPPFGVRDWGHDELAYDARWAYGVPGRSDSELAWVQHALAHVSQGGGVVLLMPASPAFTGSGRGVRAELVRTGALRAVLSLPAGALPYTGLSLQLWALQRPDPQGVSVPSVPSVLFIDTAAWVTSGPMGSRSATDWPPLTAAVLDHWHTFTGSPERFEAVPGSVRAVEAIDLLDDRVDLTPARYVNSGPDADPSATATTANDLWAKGADAAKDLATVWSGLSELKPAGDAVRAWRTATVADLGRGGALTVLTSAVTRRGADGGRTVADKGSDSGPEHPTNLLMLRATDIATGARASELAPAEGLDRMVRIEVGDVLLPEIVRDRASAATTPFRIADEEDAGKILGPHLKAFRPDPARLDSWFLGGVLSAGSNISAAASGSTTIRIDARRLRVPLLPLSEQCQYGAAFRRLHNLQTAGRRAAELATETSHFVSEALAGGTLLPPPEDPRRDDGSLAG
ncbi:N-6 DNA methylase [Streptomyces mauvecolor]|uniref:N-6 DNA methylase n=1 Tax=Streptomyces mauvecolor TaxID=58345 RepID=A0ABV9UZR4_9ACTN